MTRPPSGLPLLLALTAAGGGCTDVLLSDPSFVAVTEIEITNTTDSGSLLEVEVHLYDANTGFFLGCSGESDGLDGVNVSDVAYLVTAFFQRASDGADLTVEELRGRDVFAVVVEDDFERCPIPTNEGALDLFTDDLIGTSPVFRGEDLAFGVAFGFDDVTWIALEGVR